MGAIQNSINSALTTTAVGAGLVNKEMDKFATTTEQIGKSNKIEAERQSRQLNREAENSQAFLDDKDKALKNSIGDYLDIKENYHEDDRRKVLYGANKKKKSIATEYHDMRIQNEAINSVYRQSQAILNQTNKVNQDIAILNNRGIIGKLVARNKVIEGTKDIQGISDAHKDIYNKETK